MAFVINDGALLFMATYDDIVAADQRLFRENKGLTEEIVEDALIRSTERILTLLKDSKWWRGINGTTPVPAVDGTLIIDRQNDFSDLCVYHAFYYYLIPIVANFSDEENSERQKIDYYQTKFQSLFNELIQYGDWYDFDDDASLETDEIYPGAATLGSWRVR